MGPLKHREEKFSFCESYLVVNLASSQERTTQGCRVKKKNLWERRRNSCARVKKTKFTQIVHGSSRQPATEIDWMVFLRYLEIVKDKLYSNLLLFGHP